MGDGRGAVAALGVGWGDGSDAAGGHALEVGVEGGCVCSVLGQAGQRAPLAACRCAALPVHAWPVVVQSGQRLRCALLHKGRRREVDRGQGDHSVGLVLAACVKASWWCSVRPLPPPPCMRRLGPGFSWVVSHAISHTHTHIHTPGQLRSVKSCYAAWNCRHQACRVSCARTSRTACDCKVSTPRVSHAPPACGYAVSMGSVEYRQSSMALSSQLLL